MLPVVAMPSTAQIVLQSQKGADPIPQMSRDEQSKRAAYRMEVRDMIGREPGV